MAGDGESGTLVASAASIITPTVELMMAFGATMTAPVRDTKVYEPQIRALFGTASRFCEVVEPKTQPAGIRGADGEGVWGAKSASFAPRVPCRCALPQRPHVTPT